MLKTKFAALLCILAHAKAINLDLKYQFSQPFIHLGACQFLH